MTSYSTSWERDFLGTAVINRDLKLGVVRVPKCASSTAVAVLSADFETPIEYALRSQVRLIAAIRNPERRFLSSIPESLIRSTANFDTYSGDILVSEQNYRRIIELDGTSVERLGFSVMESIDSNGFFELHHLPMQYFLFKEDGSPRADFNLYLAERSHEFFGQFLDGRLLDASILEKKMNSRVSPPSFRQFVPAQIKRPIAKFRGLFSKSFYRYFPAQHPVLQLLESDSPVTSFDVGNLLKRIYSELELNDKFMRELKRFVRKTYPFDVEIYESFVARRQVRVELSNLVAEA